MATKYGQAIRFEQHRVRSMGRNSTGVRGIRLNADEPDDEVIGMIAVRSDEETILVVSEKGYGKRSTIADYRITNRGGKGIRTLNITEKTGKLIAILEVEPENHLMIINKSGLTIRTSVGNIRTMGRNTQGVRLINLGDNDEIASIAKIEEVEEDELDDVIIAPIGDMIEGAELAADLLEEEEIEDEEPEDEPEEDDISEDEAE